MGDSTAAGHLVSGLQDTCKACTLSMDIKTGEFLQVLNVAASHWILISTINCPPGVVNVYDSGGRYTTSRNKEEIAALLHTGKDTITLHYMNVQHQVGVSDCGLFALAFATSLCHAIDPTSVVYRQSHMRNHLIQCLERGQLDHFPIHHSRRPIIRPSKTETFDVHCHCCLTDSGPASARMIWCNGGCKQWYHDTCENIDKDVWNSRKRWYCRNCKN